LSWKKTHLNEVQVNVFNFISYVKNQFKTSINYIRTNNGVEFVMKFFYASKGIIY